MPREQKQKIHTKPIVNLLEVALHKTLVKHDYRAVEHLVCEANRTILKREPLFHNFE